MMLCKVKFLIPFLLLLNNNITYSIENDDNYQFNQLNIQEFNNIYQLLNKVNNTINSFNLLVFNADKLETIVQTNDSNVLNNIKNTLNIDFVKDHIIKNGIETKSITIQVDEYKKLFINSNLEFSYNGSYDKERNKNEFKIIYNSRFEELFNSINNKLNNIKQTTEDLKVWLQDMPNNNIKTIKLEILNKVAQYLEENKNNNKKLLDPIKNNYEEVFEEICNKPWYELLGIDENFFNEISHKIQTTNGNEQLENIHEFTKSLLTSIRILIQKEENNKLKEINDILDIKAVQQYLSEKCFYFENILKFKDKIKQEQNRSVDFYDFELFQQFIKEKIQTYLNICQSEYINY